MKIFSIKKITLLLGFLLALDSHGFPPVKEGPVGLETVLVDASRVEDFCNYESETFSRHCISTEPFIRPGQSEPSNLVLVTFLVRQPSAPDPKPKGGYGTH
ncbi:hypothetical protein [Aliikangiella coralliicola]|uniref:Uncharacterized protein n=1 Tax=Aliikangiella coralliicola TaxID=2592383 RepID=A0A545U6H5_9GAMM|nr:hypothetical protein [Aliikangiella coralliicola]TQV85066.1 hypothetical protein FLL46_22010 [Aliikangiella coralliicola]